MDFKDVLRKRLAEEPSRFLLQYFKEKQFDHPLATKELPRGKTSVFKIKASGQKVFLYERTHIPASSPVERIMIYY